VHKPRTRLLRGYEPDPVPPPTVCAKAQRPPPAEGKAVTASLREGWGTADGGPRGQQVRKRRPPQPAQLGYLTLTPSGMGNRTGPCRTHPPRYMYRGASPEARPAAPGSAPCGTQALVSILPQHHLMRIASNDAHFWSVCFRTSRPLTLSLTTETDSAMPCYSWGSSQPV